MSSEKRRLTALVIILIVASAGFVIDRFILSGDEGQTAPAPTQGVPAGAKPGQLSTGPATRQSSAAGEKSQQGYRPLPLQALLGRSGGGQEPERNVFVYYVPPPPAPRVEPVQPPPLVIHSLDPRSVFAKTKDFPVRVFGVSLPEDAQLFINGRPLATEHVNNSELAAVVEARWITAAGQLQVEVKNLSGELYSNTLTLIVQEPPVPTYKYVGRIDNLVYLQKEADERLLARLGSTVENRWRIAEIGGDKVVLEDIELGIPHQVSLEEAAGGSGPSGVQADVGFPVPQTTVSPRRGRINTPKGTVEPQQPDPVSEEEEP